MDMRLKETFTKRHVHSWTLSDKKLYPDGWVLERICPDCAKAQSGFITHNLINTLPASLVHLADIEWKDGRLREHFPLTEIDLSPIWYGP